MNRHGGRHDRYLNVVLDSMSVPPLVVGGQAGDVLVRLDSVNVIRVWYTVAAEAVVQSLCHENW